MEFWSRFFEIGIILWTISLIDVEGQNAKSSKAKNQKYYMKEKLVGRFKIVPMGKMALLNGKPPVEISAEVIGNPNPTKSPFHFPNHEEFLRKQMFDYFNHLSNTNNRLQSQGSNSNSARTPKVQKQPVKNANLGKNQPTQVQLPQPQNALPPQPYQNTPENNQKIYSNPNDNNYQVQQQQQYQHQHQHPQSQPDQHQQFQQHGQQHGQHQYQPQHQQVQNYHQSPQQGPVYQQPQQQSPVYQQQYQQQPNPHQYLNIQKVPLTQVYTQTQTQNDPQERGRILNQNQNTRESLGPEDIYTYPFPLTEQEMEFIESERERINRQQEPQEHYDGPPPPHLANVANYPTDQGELVYETPPPPGYYNGSPPEGSAEDSESEGDENQKRMKPYVTIEFEFPAGVDKDQQNHGIEKSQSQRNLEKTPMKYFINY